MRKVYLLFVVFSLLIACSSEQEEKKRENGEMKEVRQNAQGDGDLGILLEKHDEFKQILPKKISDNPFMINEKWMLVSAGADTLFNTMTASWGGFGTVWEKPVAFMFIRDTRYTFEFLQKDSVYSLSFFNEKYKDTMKMLGSKSGRNTEKIKESGLTYLKMPSGAPAFKEASMIIECKKLLSQPIDTAFISSPEVQKWYQDEPGTHHVFIGEIIGVWKK